MCEHATTRPSAQAPAAVIAGELCRTWRADYALGALNTTLYRMRRRKGLSDLIVLRDGYLSIGPKWFVDRKVLESALDTAAILLPEQLCHAATLSALADFVCAIYRGPLLEDEALDNVATARSRLQARSSISCNVSRRDWRSAEHRLWVDSVCLRNRPTGACLCKSGPACLRITGKANDDDYKLGPARSGKSPARPLAKRASCRLTGPMRFVTCNPVPLTS